MFVYIKQAHVFAPEDLGIQDVLLYENHIVAVQPHIDVTHLPAAVQEIDGTGLRLLPGLIDQHVHVTGGGGESGFTSRVPELRFSHVIESGVTTLVGTLGTDSRSRSVQNLLAKTKALNEEGITAYCLTGAYAVPSPTITGSVGDDIAFLSEVIGVKVAISDHRGMCPTKEELCKLAAEARLAGLVSGKPGVVHMHTGIGKDGLKTVIDIVDTTDIPVKHFRPTHMRKSLEADAVALAQRGGYVDYTASEDAAAQAQVILDALAAGVPFDRMTVSSDSNGSTPKWGPNKELIGITYAKMTNLWGQIQALVQAGMEFSAALSLITKNVAQALELYPQKGCIAAGSDGDVVLIDADMQIRYVIARGVVLMEQGKVLKKGFFEE